MTESIDFTSSKTGTILIVDDNETIRFFYKEFFKDFSVRILEAENGKDALEITRKIHPNLILMDLTMPVMDGFETVKVIKSDKHIKNIPVIAQSACFREVSKDWLKSHGFVSYF